MRAQSLLARVWRGPLHLHAGPQHAPSSVRMPKRGFKCFTSKSSPDPCQQAWEEVETVVSPSLGGWVPQFQEQSLVCSAGSGLQGLLYPPHCTGSGVSEPEWGRGRSWRQGSWEVIGVIGGGVWGRGCCPDCAAI